MRKRALKALLNIINFTIIFATIARLVTVGAPVLSSVTIGSVVEIAGSLALTLLIGVGHEVLQQDVVSVLPAGGTVGTITLDASGTWVVTIQNWHHDV